MAFQFFYPVNENAPLELLAKTRYSLRRGGKVLLELGQLTDRKRRLFALNDGKLRVWEELPPANPFRFYLSDLTYWDDRNMLKHKKIFIARDGSIDEGRFHVVTLYTPSQIRELMCNCGFTEVKVFESFERASYREGLSESMVVVASPA